MHADDVLCLTHIKLDVVAKFIRLMLHSVINVTAKIAPYQTSRDETAATDQKPFRLEAWRG